MTEETKENKKERLFKIFLLGDSAVGKTCFIKRFTDATFQDVYLSTIGFDYKYKTVTLKNGSKVKVQIHDTAGQERFRTISKNYYRGAQGIILLYDVTKRNTFDSIRNWVAQIKQEASSKVCVVLVANKIDVKEEERVVKKEEGEELAKSFNYPIFEASAKENINVEETFYELIEEIETKFETAPTYGTQLKPIPKNKKGCCK